MRTVSWAATSDVRRPDGMPPCAEGVVPQPLDQSLRSHVGHSAGSESEADISSGSFLCSTPCRLRGQVRREAEMCKAAEAAAKWVVATMAFRIRSEHCIGCAPLKGMRRSAMPATSRMSTATRHSMADTPIRCSTDTACLRERKPVLMSARNSRRPRSGHPSVRDAGQSPSRGLPPPARRPSAPRTPEG
jgi:hypothetical protein